MRKISRAAGVTAAAVLIVATALPASAADTVTTFTLTASGGLAITAPASTVLASAVAGGPAVSSPLGNVTATDSRGALAATWTATVSATNFTTSAPIQTVPNASVGYWSGLATATTGTAVLTPGQLTALLAQPLSATLTAYSAASTVGNNSATWAPTLVVTPPADSVVGTYSGAVTHSLA